MADTSHASVDSRRHLRLKLPPAYTLVRMRKVGSSRFNLTGHAYDVSESGMRFDLDRALEPGTEVEFRASLPGRSHTFFHAFGRVVRLHDDPSERGPVRMAVAFDRFAEEEDQVRLQTYLEEQGLRRAA